MGECGCGNTHPDFRFPGPPGVVYGVQFYQGCRDCDTPAGVIFYRWDENDDAEWFEGVPELPFRPFSDGVHADYALAVVGSERLVTALQKHLGGEPVDEYVGREVHDALEEAIQLTRQQYLDAARPSAKAGGGS
ncbi:MAG: hypothetical protein R3337_00260 [Gammaproteobacteria bacterium]|nr:hypothetical protein [Gammaproteobacteria bacterium]